MTTESDAVLATIVDNWGGGGYGGALPKIQSTADITVDRWAALDSVTVLHDTLDERHPPVNDKFVNKLYTMDIRVTSITSEDQLKLLVEETEYLLNNTAITGFTSVRITRKNRGSSDRGRKVYRNDITIEFWARVSSSAIAPDGGTFAGPTTLSSLVFSDGGSTVDIIRDEDNMSSDDAAALVTQQSIKKYVDDVILSDLDVTITGAYLEDLLMFGSANAAWQPCVFEGSNTADKFYPNGGYISNRDNTDGQMRFILPLPTNKGSLKLYISGSQVDIFDADAANKIDTVTIYGILETGISQLDQNTDDITAQDSREDPFAAVDCSGYNGVILWVAAVVADANALDISGISLRCYYAA